MKYIQQIYEKCNRNVLFFDLESTGLDKDDHDIIELYASKYDGEFSELHLKFNPRCLVEDKAFEKHGMSNEYLEQYNRLEEHKDEIIQFFKGDYVICGFNHLAFDIPMIVTKIPELVHLMRADSIDVFKEYCRLNPASLEGIYQRMFNEEFNAHEAKSDIEATCRVLNELDFEVSNSGLLDMDGFFRNTEDGPTYSKGKHRNKLVYDTDPSYLEWMISSNMSKSTRMIASKLLENHKKLTERKLQAKAKLEGK